MGTLREDITEIRVGVSTIVEHNKGIDARLKDGDERMHDHSTAIDLNTVAIEEIKGTCKERLWQGKALKFMIIQGVLTLISIIGTLTYIIFQYAVHGKVFSQ